MNTKKCCYTLYSQGGGNGLDFDLCLNDESIPYNQNPVLIRTLKIYAPRLLRDKILSKYFLPNPGIK